MNLQERRLKSAYSQDQLAQMSGLSVRTIQRIEQGHNPSLESLKSLAAVFEIQIIELQEETSNNSQPKEEYLSVKAHFEAIRNFYFALINYCLIITFLFSINLILSPEHLWAIYPSVIFLIILTHRALRVFEIINYFNENWLNKKIESRIDKNQKKK
jgi:transcriptional regulator with XRE-family HTH domain